MGPLTVYVFKQYLLHLQFQSSGPAPVRELRGPEGEIDRRHRGLGGILWGRLKKGRKNRWGDMRRRRKRRDDKPGKQIQMCVVDNVNYGCANYSFHTHTNATPPDEKNPSPKLSYKALVFFFPVLRCSTRSTLQITNLIGIAQCSFL